MMSELPDFDEAGQEEEVVVAEDVGGGDGMDVDGGCGIEGKGKDGFPAGLEPARVAYGPVVYVRKDSKAPEGLLPASEPQNKGQTWREQLEVAATQQEQRPHPVQAKKLGGTLSAAIPPLPWATASLTPIRIQHQDQDKSSASVAVVWKTTNAQADTAMSKDDPKVRGPFAEESDSEDEEIEEHPKVGKRGELYWPAKKKENKKISRKDGAKKITPKARERFYAANASNAEAEPQASKMNADVNTLKDGAQVDAPCEDVGRDVSRGIEQQVEEMIREVVDEPRQLATEEQRAELTEDYRDERAASSQAIINDGAASTENDNQKVEHLNRARTTTLTEDVNKAQASENAEDAAVEQNTKANTEVAPEVIHQGQGHEPEVKNPEHKKLTADFGSEDHLMTDALSRYQLMINDPASTLNGQLEHGRWLLQSTTADNTDNTSCRDTSAGDSKGDGCQHGIQDEWMVVPQELEPRDAGGGKAMEVDDHGKPQDANPHCTTHKSTSVSNEDAERPKVADDAMDVDSVVEEEEEIVDVDFEYPHHVADDPNRPGLSLEKLIVLALAGRRLNGTPSLTLRQIIDQIKKCSTYYRNQEVDGEAVAHPWTKNVEDILHQYDFPPEPVLDTDNGELHFQLPEGGEWFILNKPSKGKGKPFKLMELPFELKLMIYTYALHMPLPPKTGWAPDTDYTLNSKNLYTRYDRPPNRLTTNGPAGWQLRSRPVQEILALTMANKAMQAEALPVFYRTNTFYFSSPKLMGRFYAGIPNRKDWMRSIVLDFVFPSWGHECKRSIAHLFHTKLRKLHLIVDEEALKITCAVDDILNVPGVKFLGELSGIDKVTFQGNAKQLKKFLAAADITSAKRKEQMKYDTDENIDDVIEKKKKEHFKEMRLAVRQQIKDARKAATQRKKDSHRSEVADRERERKRAKRQRQAEIDAKRQARKDERERERREREALEKETKEERAARKKEEDAARQRKKNAEAKDKASRKAAKEAARAAKEGEKVKTAEQKRKEVQRKIKEQRATVKARLSGEGRGGGGRRTTEIYSALHDSTDEEDDTESDIETESDSEGELSANDYRKGTARGRPAARKAPVTVARKAPVGNKRRRNDSITDEGTDEGSTTEDESEIEAPPPPPKKKLVGHGSSIKAVANNLKRSSGTGGAAKAASKPTLPKVTPAQKIAAMGKSMQNAKKAARNKTTMQDGKKECSGRQASKKVERVVLSSDESTEDSDEFD
jgi:hypothetical protein